MWALCCHMTSSIFALLVEVMTHWLFLSKQYWASIHYRNITWSLEIKRFGFKLSQSLWHLTGTSEAALLRCLSNFRAIRSLQHPISQLRDFKRFGVKASYRLTNRDPGVLKIDTSGTTFNETFHPKSAFWKLLSAIFGHFFSGLVIISPFWD